MNRNLKYFKFSRTFKSCVSQHFLIHEFFILCSTSKRNLLLHIFNTVTRSNRHLAPACCFHSTAYRSLFSHDENSYFASITIDKIKFIFSLLAWIHFFLLLILSKFQAPVQRMTNGVYGSTIVAIFHAMSTNSISWRKIANFV